MRAASTSLREKNALHSFFLLRVRSFVSPSLASFSTHSFIINNVFVYSFIYYFMHSCIIPRTPFWVNVFLFLLSIQLLLSIYVSVFVFLSLCVCVCVFFFCTVLPSFYSSCLAFFPNLFFLMFLLSFCSPDMTFVVDWALKTN